MSKMVNTNLVVLFLVTFGLICSANAFVGEHCNDYKPKWFDPFMGCSTTVDRPIYGCTGITGLGRHRKPGKCVNSPEFPTCACRVMREYAHSPGAFMPCECRGLH